MTPTIALLDANVLYPAPLRDLLLQLAFAGVFQARWSAQINTEWTRNLLSARPQLRERIARTQTLMQRALPDALVADYESLIPNLVLPDVNDRHVLAAAIKALAKAIVTFNVRDFPSAAVHLMASPRSILMIFCNPSLLHNRMRSWLARAFASAAWCGR